MSTIFKYLHTVNIPSERVVNFDPFSKTTSFNCRQNEKALFSIIATFFGIVIFSRFDDAKDSDPIE